MRLTLIMDHTTCAHPTPNIYAFYPTCHKTIPGMMLCQLMKHQLMKHRIWDAKQKTTSPSPVSMRVQVKNTGSENWIGLSYLDPSISVPLSFEVSEIQSLILSKYIHIICGLYNNSWDKLGRKHYSYSEREKTKQLITSVKQWQLSALLIPAF